MTRVDVAPILVTPTRAIGRHALAELAEAVRLGLAASVGPGTPLGLWVDDPVDFAACVIGAMALRAEAFIVVAGATPTRARALAAIEGGTLILCEPSRAEWLGGSQQSCGPGLVLVDLGGRPTLGDHDRGAVHFSTSGTDGTPKGVSRTKASLELEEATVGAHLGMGPGTTVLCAVPPTHGYGYTAGVFAPMSFGGTSVVAQPKLAASLARLLSEHEPDIVVAVPSQYAAWSALRRPFAGRLPRVWLCGGAPLPLAVRARFQEAWGTVIAEQYGMTEVGAVTVDLDGAETLGRPYPGVSVAIDAPDADGVGELLVRAPYGPSGYVGDAAPQRFTADGVRSGDSGWFDTDGRLHLVGRRAHQLNVHGQKVDPSEVEQAFWALSGVREVAVIGVDRADGDQWIAAFVACPDTISDDALRAATDHLDAYKRPMRVTRVESLPKNAIGKTDPDALRALARG